MLSTCNQTLQLSLIRLMLQLIQVYGTVDSQSSPFLAIKTPLRAMPIEWPPSSHNDTSETSAKDFSCMNLVLQPGLSSLLFPNVTIWFTTQCIRPHEMVFRVAVINAEYQAVRFCNIRLFDTCVNTTKWRTELIVKSVFQSREKETKAKEPTMIGRPRIRCGLHLSGWGLWMAHRRVDKVWKIQISNNL